MERDWRKSVRDRFKRKKQTKTIQKTENKTIKKKKNQCTLNAATMSHLVSDDTPTSEWLIQNST